MKHDSGYSMDFFLSCVNHRSRGGLVGAFRGVWGSGKEKRYIKLVEERECKLFGEGMKISFKIL
jgi:hypothetical protein